MAGLLNDFLEWYNIDCVAMHFHDILVVLLTIYYFRLLARAQNGRGNSTFH